ncbi:GtrA family protein [Candidatus Kuenenbacteria bacterium]|nr:GtrA family protein [Candidatus Kuenenbacteria bacterium]
MIGKIFYNLYNKLADKIRNIPIVRKHPTAKELIKYSIVGNFSNILDLVLYVILTRSFIFWHENYLFANVLTMVVGSLSRFFLHKKWTFRHDTGSFHEQYLRFIAVMFVSLILSTVLLFLTVEYLLVNDIVGKLIATAIITLIVYYLTKIWVFKKGIPCNKF